jgi:hypothetical protein
VTVRQEDRHHHQRGAPAGESFPSDDLVDGPTGIAGGQLSGAPAREAPPGTTVWQQARRPRGTADDHGDPATRSAALCDFGDSFERGAEWHPVTVPAAREPQFNATDDRKSEIVDLRGEDPSGRYGKPLAHARALPEEQVPLPHAPRERRRALEFRPRLCRSAGSLLHCFIFELRNDATTG